MLPDKVLGQGVELWLLGPGAAIVLTIEVADVQEGNNQVVKRIQAFLLHREAPITVRCIATLDLYTDLRLFNGARLMTCVRVDTDQVIAFIPRGRFVSEDVAPHELSHHQVFGSSSDNWQS